jgi:histidinol-phosphate aminotransferase
MDRHACRDGAVVVEGVVRLHEHLTRVHGGPDARGPARWDFSTNANAAGPCPEAVAAVREADATRYPDPSYHALRERLAQWHGVDPGRILWAASASEFIQRVTAVSARHRPGPVAIPPHAYGDYETAARASNRAVARHTDPSATLCWHCEPSSPCGQDAPPFRHLSAAIAVLDLVYAPLRLDGTGTWSETARQAVFELHSPNKALGLTGIRGAYAIAPRVGNEELIDALSHASPSWPLGAHAVAMLDAWASPATQQWLAESRDTLREWKRAQIEMLLSMGAEVSPSVANFFCVRLPFSCDAAHLRARGIAVRDAASFGLPAWLRLSVQPPQAQDQLQAALRALVGTQTSTKVSA